MKGDEHVKSQLWLSAACKSFSYNWIGKECLYLELCNADLGLARCNLIEQILEGRGALLHVCLCNNQTPHVPVPLHLHQGTQ